MRCWPAACAVRWVDMLQVEKKRRRSRSWLRWVLLALLLAVLGGTVLTLRLLNKPIAYNSLESPVTYGELIVHEAAEVIGVSVAMPGSDSWALVRQENGMVMVDDPDFPLDTTLVDSILEAARIVSYSSVLTEDPAEYRDQLGELGLADPTVVHIMYADGSDVTLRIGNHSDDLDSAYYYMLVDGDDRLFGLDPTTASTLNLERYLLHAVTQPVIHKARINAISIELPERTLRWELAAGIDDADAADRWMLTQPKRYAADGERMDSLRENLANLRLGAYVADATPENLTEYGFDAPRLVLTIDQGAGTVGSAGTDGVYGLTEWPASTITLAVGAAKSDYVDYVLYNGCICMTSHYSMQTLMDMDAQSTLTRYPVLTSLSNLSSLTITQGETTHTWTIEDVDVLDEDGMPVQNEDGQYVLERAVSMDGAAVSYEAFEASYNQLLIATVSGALPEAWQPIEPAHTTYTFHTRTGVEHTIALIAFDALHDAVIVDGCAMFYIIRGGLAFMLMV